MILPLKSKELDTATALKAPRANLGSRPYLLC